MYWFILDVPSDDGCDGGAGMSGIEAVVAAAAAAADGGTTGGGRSGGGMAAVASPPPPGLHATRKPGKGAQRWRNTLNLFLMFCLL